MSYVLEVIVGAPLAIILVASVAMWMSAFERVRHGEAVVAFAARRPVPWGLLDLLVIFLLFVFSAQAALVVVRQQLGIPLNRHLEELQAGQLGGIMLAGSAATLASCLASLVWLAFRAGATRKDLGFVAAAMWSDIKLGTAAFVMLAPPMYLMQYVLTQFWEYEHPVQQLLERHLDRTMLQITLFAAVVVAPLAEEIYFRVILQGWLENASVLVRKAFCLVFDLRQIESQEIESDVRAVMLGDHSGESLLDHVDGQRFPRSPAESLPIDFGGQPRRENELRPDHYTALQFDADAAEGEAARLDAEDARPAGVFRPGHVPLVISAAVFALMHFGHGPAPIPLFFLAIGLGYLYRQTHRATPSIVVHFLINAVSMAVLWASLVFKQ